MPFHETFEENFNEETKVEVHKNRTFYGITLTQWYASNVKGYKTINKMSTEFRKPACPTFYSITFFSPCHGDISGDIRENDLIMEPLQQKQTTGDTRNNHFIR